LDSSGREHTRSSDVTTAPTPFFTNFASSYPASIENASFGGDVLKASDKLEKIAKMIKRIHASS
jgi:hypothetical protein